MADPISEPRVSKHGQSIHLSYELPYRIYTSCIYPIKSSNGSTITLLGHENGVSVIWRGGRAFKPQQTSSTSAPEKTNGAGNTVVLLDSDDEGESNPKFEDKPEFVDQEEEFDASRPFPEIVQSLDLHFGTDVLHLAVLPASVVHAKGASWKGGDILKGKIVFTAACADNSLRVVTLPLTPPSPASKARPELRAGFMTAYAGNGSWGETVTMLSGHQKLSDGISMSLDFGSDAKDVVKAESKPSGFAEPCLIISSHSKEVTGLLLLFRVPLKTKTSHFESFQRIYLPSPATCISFNPSLSTPRSSHLLVADSTGVCRIYDYKLLARSSEDPESLAAEQGTWLISFYAGFPKERNDTPLIYGSHAGFGRKAILDAEWVSSGRGIIILMSDGEWAVWDIEGVGATASQGILGRQGVKGGSRTEYSLSGYIERANKSLPSATTQATNAKFAPMTPGTRKSTIPFANHTQSGPLRGSISVLEIPSPSPTTPSEESILFWLGETYTFIPSLQKYWATNANKSSVGSGSVFGSHPNSRMIKLDGIDLRGERCSGITQIPKTQPSTGFPSDILVLAEHRFTVLASGKAAKEPLFSQSSGRLALQEKSFNNGGELDVLGIEKALAKMENGHGNGRKKLF